MTIERSSCNILYIKYKQFFIIRFFLQLSTVINVFIHNLCSQSIFKCCVSQLIMEVHCLTLTSLRMNFLTFSCWIYWARLIDSWLPISLLSFRHTFPALGEYGACQGQLLWWCYTESDLTVNHQHYLWINYPAPSFSLYLLSSVSRCAFSLCPVFLLNINVLPPSLPRHVPSVRSRKLLALRFNWSICGVSFSSFPPWYWVPTALKTGNVFNLSVAIVIITPLMGNSKTWSCAHCFHWEQHREH